MVINTMRGDHPDSPAVAFFTRRRVIVALYALIIVAALTQIIPFGLMLVGSVKCLAAINAVPLAVIPTPPTADCRDERGSALPSSATSTALTFNPTTEGYERAFADDYGTWLFNSLALAIAITALRLVFDTMAGYALARIRFPGSRALFNLVLVALMTPIVVLIIPRFIILKQMDLLNNYAGVLLPLMVSAFGIFLMKQFFETLPSDIEDAGLADGANRFTLFFTIILPMATPALASLAILSFQAAWNNFIDVLIVLGSEPDLWTLPLGLSYSRGASGETLLWNEYFAGSVVATLPILLLFILFQRYFVINVAYSGLLDVREST